MSFIHRFYNINLDLSLCHKGVYQSYRLKVPQFEDEDLIELFKRVICFAHCFQETICFSKTEPKNLLEIQKSDLSFEYCANIGEFSEHTISLVKNQKVSKDFVFYFTSNEQITEFCRYLKGSKTNWVKEYNFYRLNITEVNQADFKINEYERLDLSKLEKLLNNKLYITIVDQFQGMLICDEIELSLEFQQIDIWDQFQKIIIQT